MYKQTSRQHSTAHTTAYISMTRHDLTGRLPPTCQCCIPCMLVEAHYCKAITGWVAATVVPLPLRQDNNHLVIHYCLPCCQTPHLEPLATETLCKCFGVILFVSYECYWTLSAIVHCHASKLLNPSPPHSGLRTLADVRNAIIDFKA